MTATFKTYTICDKVQESEIITSFHLKSDTPLTRDFVPGEYLVFEVPAGAQGEMIRREYSISGEIDGALRVTIKREPATAPDLPSGRVSAYFHDNLDVGSTVKAAGPAGKFLLDRTSERPVVLLSGGVGLTPLVAMARDLAGQPQRRVTFIHACENGRVHAMAVEMRALAKTAPHLKTHFCYRLPESGDKPGRDYDSTGFITRGTLQSLLPLDDYEFYLCGPTAFMQAMYDLLFELGVAMDRVKYEFFGPATVLRPVARIADPQTTANAKADDVSQPTVTFAKSGLSACWDPQSDSLLDFAEEQGLMPDFSCRAGTCESCKTRVLAGETEYALEPFERPTDGSILLCCSTPRGDVTLDL